MDEYLIKGTKSSLDNESNVVLKAYLLMGLYSLVGVGIL